MDNVTFNTLHTIEIDTSTVDVTELNLSQLSAVGGGCGEVIFG